ncbi:hypothetical protein [Rubellicoccus peritrichatus]|uniref:Verru_Chthon cassette protein A n=1 Tax=Rubellicoccus peritrichatus TaxID=3080537 RepID=A0AAQ3QY14_9BACT|nr:hypothetical protein [Puniceicoccus sp. CR14]WOO43622.1 hypothetical protein RZN69_11030 [Puniceicoccus sp. CR14]
MLLLLSLGVLVRVETQVAVTNMDRQLAEQNALLALNLALAELQKSAGPDQRATAPAVLGEGATGVTAAEDASNGLISNPGAGMRYWTGVWGNSNSPQSSFSESPDPVLLNWLVSGNHASIVADTEGMITSPAAAQALDFTPASSVTGLTRAADATTALSIGSTPAVLMLGSGTADNRITTDNPTGADDFVVAPLVNIEGNQRKDGRYAWWVGDEGVKAKYNVTDYYIENTTPDSGTSVNSRDSRYRVLSSQRNGIERMTAFGGANYPLASTSKSEAVYGNVAKTTSMSQLPVALTGIPSQNLKTHVHDLTTNSLGVLADSQFGGLRRDLSFHLDPLSGDTFLNGRNILPDGTSPVADFSGSQYTAAPSLFSETAANGGRGYTDSGGDPLDLSPRLGPKWDQVKSFYEIAYTQPTNLEVQPVVDIDVNPVKVQFGITPVFLEGRSFFAVKAGPIIDFSVIFILGNPYTRPLTAPDGLNIRMELHPMEYSTASNQRKRSEFGLRCVYHDQASSISEPVFTRNESIESSNYYPILKHAVPPHGDLGLADPNAGVPGVLDDIIFQIPPGLLNLAPGEAKAYWIDSSGASSTELINGVNFTVLPLEEMVGLLLPWGSHNCHSVYLSSSPLLPAGLLDGSAAFPNNANFTVGIVGSGKSTLDYTLTIPGSPKSVLQKLGPLRINSIEYDLPAGTNVFEPTLTEIAGIRNYRVFGNDKGAGASSDEPLATHSESNILGANQIAMLYRNFNLTQLKRYFMSFVRVDYESFATSTDFLQSLEITGSTQAAWGEGSIGDPARVPPDGKYILNDVPAAMRNDEIPIHSIAHLQHLDLSADDEALGVNAQPGHIVGNSRYNRFVPRNASRIEPLDNHRAKLNSDLVTSSGFGDTPWWYDGYVPALSKSDQIRHYDISYLLNTALWDTYFFSTVRPSGAGGSLAPSPANRRIAYWGDVTPTLGQLFGSASSTAIPVPGNLASGESGRVPAAFTLIDGAFNVNSTSVEAWKAVLSAHRGVGVGTDSATIENDSLTPFSRSIRQPGNVQDELPSAGSAKSADETYTGLRALTDDQISTLATEIVAQVRARGPFVSLSHFINRNLTGAANPGDEIADTGLSGAIQQAIDRSGVNANLNEGSGLPQVGYSLGLDYEYPDDQYMPDGNDSGLSSYMAAPGWLSQADVLQTIGPTLAARSDTFLIRAYGEVLGIGGAQDVTARAWCEAVVQRLPDYIDDSDYPTVVPSQADPVNQMFGRQFRVLSLRWLSPDEV